MRGIAAFIALMAASISAPTQSWPTQTWSTQTWPNRPITIVVPFLAGGASDVIARLLADGLRAELGPSVVVENIGGAGGMVGTSRVAKSPPDGYQLVLGNVGTHAHNQSLYKKPLYNVATDFAPVALLADQSLVLAVRRDLPVGP